MINRRFGSLVVKSESQIKTRDGKRMWECLCDCGNMAIRSRGHLSATKKTTLACDECKNVDKNKSKVDGYRSWHSAFSRTTKPNHKDFPSYGGRGLLFCERWNPEKGGSFSNFILDMGRRPDRKSVV